MNKAEFLSLLEQRLSVLPESDKKRSIRYFDEMIADRMEEGLSEEEAVACLESVDEIAEGILRETTEPVVSAGTEIKEKTKDFHGIPIWLLILLAVVGAPLWLPVAISIAVTVVSIYCVPWCLILSIFCCAAGCFFGGIAGVIFGIVASPGLGVFGAVLLIGISVFCIGFGLLLLFPAVFFTKWLAKGTAWCWRKIFSSGKEKKKNEAC